MRIGVASHDGVGVSEHFGRSRFLLVFDVADGRVRGMERRVVRAAKAGEPHEHGPLLALARDCQMLISGGMGARMAAELRRMGVRPFLVGGAPCSARTGLARVLDGRAASETPHPYCCEARRQGADQNAPKSPDGSR